MRYLISLLMPLTLFSSVYKDHVGYLPLRIESKSLLFVMDKKHNLDEISAKNDVTVRFADKIVIETDEIQYVDHSSLKSLSSGTCHLVNGELRYQKLDYDLKKDELRLTGVSGNLCLEDDIAPVTADHFLLDRKTLIFEGNVSLQLPILGTLHAETNLQILHEHLFILGNMDLVQKDFHLHSSDQFHFDSQEERVRVTSKKDRQILFETNELKLFANDLILHYEKGHPKRVELTGNVRIDPNTRYVAFDTLLCDRVDFPIEESAMLLVTKGHQQHLFWESDAPNKIYLGEGEIPKR